MKCVFCNKIVLLAQFPKEIRTAYKNPTYHIKCLYDKFDKDLISQNTRTKSEVKNGKA